MEREEIIKGIVKRCRENITLLEEKKAIAWDDMDKSRCPLWMTDSGIYEDIEEEMADFFADYDIDEESVDIDIEEDIFYKL